MAGGAVAGLGDVGKLLHLNVPQFFQLGNGSAPPRLGREGKSHPQARLLAALLCSGPGAPEPWPTRKLKMVLDANPICEQAQTGGLWERDGGWDSPRASGPSS